MWPGKSLYRGKVTIPLVQLSIYCRIGCWCIGNFCLQLVNNQAHSKLTTAHAVLSPSPCIEFSLVDVNKNPQSFELMKSRRAAGWVLVIKNEEVTLWWGSVGVVAFINESWFFVKFSLSNEEKAGWDQLVNQESVGLSIQRFKFNSSQRHRLDTSFILYSSLMRNFDSTKLEQCHLLEKRKLDLTRYPVERKWYLAQINWSYDGWQMTLDILLCYLTKN